MPPPSSFHPHDPATQQALKRIALSFLRDDSAAEDVVQEVWLASLEHAPAEYESSSAWLVAVTKNIARGELRRRIILSDTEARYAVPEATDASDQRLERRSLRQALVGAIDELDRQTAEIIRARYLEGRTSVEIAEETAETPSTVRSRLKRGLEKIRARLEPEFGGSVGFSVALIHGFDWTPAEWASAIGSNVAIDTAGVGASESTAVAAGKAGLPAMAWFAVAALAAMTVSIVMWVTLVSDTGDAAPAAPNLASVAREDQSSSIIAPAQDVSRTRAKGGTQPAKLSQEGTFEDPGPVAPAASSAETQLSNESGATSDSGVAVVSTVDENGQRVPGAKVFVHRDGTPEQRAISDEDGTARVRWTKADLQPITSPHLGWHKRPVLKVTAEFDGLVSSGQFFIDPKQIQEGLDIQCVLRGRPIEVRGRVIGPSGNGVAGARLVFGGPSWTLASPSQSYAFIPYPPDAWTGEDGRFHVKGIDRRMKFIVSRVEGLGAGQVQLPETPEEVIDVTLELLPAASFEGRVSTLEGNGVEGVHVSVHLRRDSLATTLVTETSEDGAFSIEHIPPGEFEVRFVGAEVNQRALLKFFPDQVHRKDVIVGARPQLSVQTVDNEGRTVAFVKVMATARRSRWKTVVLTDENGRAIIPSTPIPGQPGIDGRVIPSVNVSAFTEGVDVFPVVSRSLTELPDKPLTISIPTRLDQLASLSFTLTDHQQRVPDALVILQIGMIMQNHSIDPATGAFDRDRLPPGQADILLQSPWSQHFHLRRVQLQPGPNDLGHIELPELGKIEVDWRWPEDGDAALYVIRAITRYGTQVRRPVLINGVAGGGSHDVLPGEHLVFTRNAAGKTLMSQAIMVEPGQTKRVQLGAAAPRIGLVRMKWTGTDESTCSMTTRTVPIAQIGMTPTAAEKEAAFRSATPSEPRTVNRDSTGHFVFDIELQEPSYVSIVLTDSHGNQAGTTMGLAKFESGTFIHECVVD